jgi:hypothetical protein
LRRRAFVHIGAPKTGSKSLQHFLSQNKAVLQRAGILYPGDGMWHDRIASALMGSDPRFIANAHAGLSDPVEIRALDDAFMAGATAEMRADQVQTVVLSYEGFFQPDARLARRLRRMLSDVAGEVTIVAYLRHPVPWAESSYSTRAILGFPGGTDILKDAVLPIRETLGVYVDAFGHDRIAVRCFDRRRLVGADVRTDFLDLIGLDRTRLPDLDFASIDRNVALSVPAIILAEAIREAMPRALGTSDFYRRFAACLGAIPGPQFRLNAEQREAVERAFGGQRAYLAAEFGLIFDSDPRPPAVEDDEYRREVERARAVAKLVRAALAGPPA